MNLYVNIRHEIKILIIAIKRKFMLYMLTITFQALKIFLSAKINFKELFTNKPQKLGSTCYQTIKKINQSRGFYVTH